MRKGFEQDKTDRRKPGEAGKRRHPAGGEDIHRTDKQEALEELESFFLSEWTGMLSDVDGACILRKPRKKRKWPEKAMIAANEQSACELQEGRE